MRVALVRPGSAAQQQPTLGAGGVQGARAGPARRGRQVVSAGPRAALLPSQPILHGDRADVPGASRGQRAGAFASGGRGEAQVGVGRRCQRVQPSRRVDGARDKRGAAAEAARRRPCVWCWFGLRALRGSSRPRGRAAFGPRVG